MPICIQRGELLTLGESSTILGDHQHLHYLRNAPPGSWTMYQFLLLPQLMCIWGLLDFGSVLCVKAPPGSWTMYQFLLLPQLISSFGNCGCLFCFLMMPTHKVTVDAYLDKVNSFGEIEKKQSKALNISCKLNNVACNKLKLEDYRKAEKVRRKKKDQFEQRMDPTIVQIE
ncbi:hypothetical protein EJB05_54015, partial [Eragrostis curvula]